MRLRIYFYYHYLKAIARWHLRRTRSKPGRWRLRGRMWSTVMTYHKDRWVWGREARRAKESWYRRINKPLEMTMEYRQEGSAGKGDYIFEIPKTGWKE